MSIVISAVVFRTSFGFILDLVTCIGQEIEVWNKANGYGRSAKRS
ncbi:MAG TPA: hypothetical protein PK745_00135 [bacterium]|nr:hypothetical protein [bacterium]